MAHPLERSCDPCFAVLAPFTTGVVSATPPTGGATAVLGFGRPSRVARLARVAGSAVAVVSAPYTWRSVGPVTLRLLGPSRAMVPANRIDEMTARRADTTVAQAAEIRRIERHLHGGAKARLVPLGLSLATAERLPATAPTRPRRPPALSPNRRLALTERGLSVPGLIVEALSNQAIGQRLFLSESSISKRAASRPGGLDTTDDDSNNRRAHAVLNPPPA